MKLRIAIIAILMMPNPVIAHHKITMLETCKATRISERYQQGYTDGKGNYVKGKVITYRERIPCNAGEQQTAHYQAPPQYQQTTPYPYQYQPPTQTSAPSPPIHRCDQLARMGLTAGGGALLGRYVGGGVKSRHTIRNTTIGAVAGGIIGRIIPC